MKKIGDNGIQTQGFLVKGKKINNKSLRTRTGLVQTRLVVKTFTIVFFPEIERALV